MVRQFTKHAKYGTIKKGRFEAQKAPSVRSHVSGHDCKRALRKANWLKIVNAEAENWLSKKMCWNGLVEKEREPDCLMGTAPNIRLFFRETSLSRWFRLLLVLGPHA